MNNLVEGEQTLSNALENFSGVWADSCELWNDDAKRHFEAEFASFVLIESPILRKRFQELGELFEQARREVE
jgi:hypothetical protein